MLKLSILATLVAAVSAFDARWANSSSPATTSAPGVVTTTEVVTAYTTYCPAPTVITQGSKTYTVTSATTLTITDCPCTITKTKTKPTMPMSTGTGPATSPKIYPNTTVIVPYYTTTVVTAFTTYCPSATTITQGTQTYTVTGPSTLTITNCPCTITTPVGSVETICGPVAPVSEYTDGQPQATQVACTVATVPGNSGSGGSPPGGSSPAGGAPPATTNAPQGPATAPATAPAQASNTILQGAAAELSAPAAGLLGLVVAALMA